eukprot:jgi/Orpsp1_1/1186993/evm.model.d7180000054691.1
MKFHSIYTLKIYNNQNLLILFFLWIFFFINYCYSYAVTIRSTKKDIQSLEEVLHNNSNYKDGITIYFPDPYYDFSTFDLWSAATVVDNSISLIGTSQNYTIFDYGSDCRYSLAFTFNKQTIKTLYVKGIIFKHFYGPKINLFTFNLYNDIFHIVFDDCQFIDIYSTIAVLYSVEINCSLNKDNYHHLEFNNCQF